MASFVSNTRIFLGAMSLVGCRDASLSDSAGFDCEPLVTMERTTWLAEELPQRSALRSVVGLSIGDLDGDVDLDVFVAWAGGSFWMRNDGSGGLELVDELLADGSVLDPGTSTALGDLDRDGDLDVVLGTWVDLADQILWNDGGGNFSVEYLPESSGYTRSPVIGDLNGDGWLDVFVGRGLGDSDIPDIIVDLPPGTPSSLYLGSSDGMVAASEQLDPVIHDAHTQHAGVLDVEGDGDLDIYLSNDYGPYIVPNQLLLNDGNAQFLLAENCDCNIPIYGMGVAVGDGSGDGHPDLYMSDIGSPDYLVNTGSGQFYDATVATGALIPAQEDQLTSWGTTFVDLNQDRWMDVAVVYGRLGSVDSENVDRLDPTWVDGNAQRDALLLGDGSGGFVNATDEVGFDNSARNRSVVIGDLNQDGLPELMTAGREELSINSFSGGCGSGVTVALGDGEGDPGIGARIEFVAESHTSTQWMLPSTAHSSSVSEVYLGLGSARRGEVRVTWLDGRTARLDVVDGDRVRIEPD